MSFSESHFLGELKKRRDFFEDELESSLTGFYQFDLESLKLHKEALFYSILNSGKRFRPLLCLVTAESIGISPKMVMPFACALEMVHNYSLVHDDLPILDNDDFRRGRPTTHKQYSESTALLVGDSLLTDSFSLLAVAYKTHPQLSTIVQLLADSSGSKGMIAGQVVDLWVQKNLGKINLEKNLIVKMHQLKTGKLISAAVTGACTVGQLVADAKNSFGQFADLLGLAFQIKDDILDAEEESFGLPAVIGLEATHSFLAETDRTCLEVLKSLKLEKSLLADFVFYNSNRSH